MKSLKRIGKKHGTDKYKHGYLPFYDKYFSSKRGEPIDFLEIGIFEGNSLRMWRDYFFNGTIVGCDINKDSFIVGDRIECCYLDQSSAESLNELRVKFSSGFDIIVDDGSHIVSHQHVSLGALFPTVQKGGFYVIEDIHTSLGESEKCYEMYGLHRDMSNSAVMLLDRYGETGKIESEYLSDDEKRYLEENIESFELFRPKNWSATMMIKKR